MKRKINNCDTSCILLAGCSITLFHSVIKKMLKREPSRKYSRHLLSARITL
ncbi:hypothetical protein A225_2659 [Klebsiella michiganensis E718]|nr:hypothetical protein A225_2659 [Klebsiella michiganensis E718]